VVFVLSPNSCTKGLENSQLAGILILILIPAQLPQKGFEFLREQKEEEGEFLFQVLCG
jgi:hypothetical protein